MVKALSEPSKHTPTQFPALSIDTTTHHSQMSESINSKK